MTSQSNRDDDDAHTRRDGWVAVQRRRSELTDRPTMNSDRWGDHRVDLFRCRVLRPLTSVILGLRRNKFRDASIRRWKTHARRQKRSSCACARLGLYLVSKCCRELAYISRHIQLRHRITAASRSIRRIAHASNLVRIIWRPTASCCYVNCAPVPPGELCSHYI